MKGAGRSKPSKVGGLIRGKPLLYSPTPGRKPEAPREGAQKNRKSVGRGRRFRRCFEHLG